MTDTAAPVSLNWFYITLPGVARNARHVTGIVSVLALRETARQPLPGSAPCVASRAEALSPVRRRPDEARGRDRKLTPVSEHA